MQLTDAVAAIIVNDGGRYLMQRRDDNPDIPFPDYWGLFGGAIDPGETPEHALRRELLEELEFRLANATYFTRFDFDLQPLALRRCYREFYVVQINEAEVQSLVLHEGAEMGLFEAFDVLTHPKVTPYDSYALWLHHNRGNFYV